VLAPDAAQAVRLPGRLRDDALHLRAQLRGRHAVRQGGEPGLRRDLDGEGGQVLHNLVESRRGSDKPLRILSVAAGPAQELLELLEELDEVTVPLEIVLFDQDKGSLAYAFRRLRPKADKHRKKRVQILYLHDSIKRLLRDAKLFAQFGEFDAIYSSGLFDYLSASTATILTRNLFARLAPGGKLLVGNMVPENPGRWIMEQHLDWHLTYRSRAEQLEIARRAAPNAHVQILEEETGVNPFVELIRG
jgi:extracellular factor (EF) 3-hydroxypalmitic acid methyl ester biosynthesis protein